MVKRKLTREDLRVIARAISDISSKKFDPHQLRDPHTGEWTDAPGGEALLSQDVPAYMEARQPELSEASMAAFEDYQAVVGHFANRYLRGDEDLEGMPEGLTVDDLKSTIAHLDEGFERSGPIGRPVKVWRGVKEFSVRAGQTVDESAFASTSSDRAVAEDAAYGSEEVSGQVWELTVHPSVKAIWINKAFPGLYFEHEMELLLQRGCRIVVLSVDGRHVKATVLSPS